MVRRVVREKKKPRRQMSGASVTRVQRLLQEENLTETKHRYSQRIRRQFKPFTNSIELHPVRKKTVPVQRKIEKLKGQTGKARRRPRLAAERNQVVPVVAKASNDTAEISTAVRTGRKRKATDTSAKRKRHKNDLLEVRDIEQYAENPDLTSKELPVFVSVSSYSRMALRHCIYQGNSDRLRNVMYDCKHFSRNHIKRKLFNESEINAGGLAAMLGDSECLKTYIELSKADDLPVAFEYPVLLKEESTGQMNINMLGHATAAIQMTRGGREGINALLIYECHRVDWNSQLNFFLQNNVAFDIIDFIVQENNLSYNIALRAYEAVRFGHRDLAAYIIQKYSPYNFNQLHIETLTFSDKQMLTKFKSVSTTKRSRPNRDITPMHTAAINPNVMHLKTLLKVQSQPALDADGWSILHYAAACESTEPVKHLLGIGMSSTVLTKRKMTPLHCAAQAGREKNMMVLIDASKNAESRAAEGIESDDVGPANAALNKHFVNLKSKDGETALHLATKYGHLKAVERLLAQPEIIVDAIASAKAKSVTPLMIACQKGFLKIANLLIDQGGSVVEKGDKLKRTALTHAVLNGHVHVVAMLLRRGASPLAADSSGNTPAHYATAYGWLSCLRLLAKADPVCLSKNNDWHLAPITVAYLKGHMKIMDWLLNGPFASHVDINCRDQNGATIVITLTKCSSESLDTSYVKQLKLIIEKGIDCSLKDTNLNTAIHYLALAKCKLNFEENIDCSDKKLTTDQYFQCIDLLIEKGADYRALNNNGENALIIGLKAANLPFSEYLFEKFLKIDGSLQSLQLDDSSSENECILHLLIALPFKVLSKVNESDVYAAQYNIIPFLNKMVAVDKNQVCIWLHSRDDEGRTPLVLLCHEYNELSVGKWKNANKILEMICDVVKLLIALDPKIVFGKIEKKEKTDEDDGGPEKKKNKAEGVIDYAIIGNRDYTREVCKIVVGNEIMKFTNNLMAAIINGARDANLLNELLVQRDFKDYTPLIRAIYKCDEPTSMFLLRAAHGCQGSLKEKVDAAVVKVKYCSEQKKYIPWNKTVLMFAVQKQLINVISELNLSESEWNACNSGGNNAFHFASEIISHKAIAIYELLKKKGVTIKANNGGQYPIHLAVNAVLKGSSDLLISPVEWFIQQKVGLHEPDEFGRLPLHYSFIDYNQKCHKLSVIDPISVLTVLINSMDKCTQDEREEQWLKVFQSRNAIPKGVGMAQIDIPDNDGYTALHYAAARGANVCVVTLLHANANVNKRNRFGNTPLAVAVFNKQENCTLTLIQAGGSVSEMVNVEGWDENACQEKHVKWVWIPLRSNEGQKAKPVPISSKIVENGWAPMVYMSLNFLGEDIDSVSNLLCAALEHRKYNLALMLLGKLETLLKSGEYVDKAKRSIPKNFDFFNVMVDHITVTTLDDNITKIVTQLLSFRCQWYYVRSDGQLSSDFVGKLVKKGCFEILHWLRTNDAESSNPKWDKLVFDNGANNPLSCAVEWWIANEQENGEEEDKADDLEDGNEQDELYGHVQYWLKHFAEKSNINTLMEYPRPAFDGMNPCLPREPEPEFFKATALIRAINCRKISLIQFLLKESGLTTDVNQPDQFDVTPLMHACLVNSRQIVKLLLDPHTRDSKDRESLLRAERERPHVAKKFSDRSLYHTLGDEHPVLSRDGDFVNKMDECGSRNRFVKKTNLDLCKLCMGDNNRSKNFVHFMVEPCGWENVCLLDDICKSFPVVENLITQSSSFGKDDSPISIAKSKNQVKMFNAMAKISKLQASVKLPLISTHLRSNKLDIDGDSRKFSSLVLDRRVKKTEKEKAKVELMPHKNSGYQQTGEICVQITEDGNTVPYKVVLMKTDITYGRTGFHNFYRLQLIKRKGSDLFILFTNWGRIGDDVGQYQRTPFGTLAAAEKEFSSIFRAKTGNEFAEINFFEVKPNKYHLLGNNTDIVEDISDLTIDFSKSSALIDKSKRSSLYKLIMDFSNVERLQCRTRTIRQYRSHVPFGCLSRENILKARDILSKLSELLKTSSPASNGPELILKLARSQASLTNDFYRLLPFGGFENARLPMIDSKTQVEQFAEIIEELLEMEITGRLITAAAFNMNKTDPYLYILDSLDCEIAPIDPDNLMAQYILQSIQASSPESHVRGIYEIKSKRAADAFNKKAVNIENHRYLWHGTKPENMLSILKCGLLAAPRNALQTGQAFGKGIYFSDVFEKSRHYCTESVTRIKYALLCQVALGVVATKINSYGEIREQTPYDTLKILGRSFPDPVYNMTLEDGCVFPLGPVIEWRQNDLCDAIYLSMDFSEFIVQDDSFAMVRYLVAFQ